MEDYLRTNALWTGHIGRYPELDIDTRAAIVEARTPYLEAAFEVVREDFGGPEGFAEGALGLDAAASRAAQGGFAGDRPRNVSFRLSPVAAMRPITRYDTPEPFKVDIPERALIDLDERLRRWRPPARIADDGSLGLRHRPGLLRSTWSTIGGMATTGSAARRRA